MRSLVTTPDWRAAFPSYLAYRIISLGCKVRHLVITPRNQVRLRGGAATYPYLFPTPNTIPLPLTPYTYP